MTPRLTRRGLFAAGIAALIGTRPTYAQPVHGGPTQYYTAPASTYISPASSHVCNEFTISDAGRDSWVSDIKITITGTNGAILSVADKTPQELTFDEVVKPWEKRNP